MPDNLNLGNILGKSINRNIRMFDDGIVVKVNDNGSDDIQVGYREFPYSEVNKSLSSGRGNGIPVLSQPGDQVRVGFLHSHKTLAFELPRQMQAQISAPSVVTPTILAGIWSQFEGNPQRNNCTGQPTPARSSSWNGSLFYQLPSRFGQIFGLVVLQSHYVAVAYPRFNLEVSDWEAICLDWIKPDGSLAEHWECPTAGPSGAHLQTVLAANPINSHCFVAPHELQDFFAFWNKGDGSQGALDTPYSNLYGCISYAGQTVLLAGTSYQYTPALVAETFGAIPAWPLVISNQVELTRLGGWSGLVREGNTEAITSAFTLYPDDLAAWGGTGFVVDSIQGLADRGWPANLNCANWYATIASRDIFNSASIADVARSVDYAQNSITIPYGYRYYVPVQNYHRNLKLQILKFSTTTGAVVGGVQCFSLNVSDVYIDTGTDLLANFRAYLGDANPYSSTTTTAGWRPDYRYGDPIPPLEYFPITMIFQVGDGWLPEGYFSPKLSLPLGNHREIPRCGSLGEFPFLFPAACAGAPEGFTAPLYTFFRGTGISVFPRPTSNDPLIGAGTPGTYDDGGIDTFAAFTSYLVDSNNQKGANAPGLYVASGDGAVFVGFARPYRFLATTSGGELGPIVTSLVDTNPENPISGQTTTYFVGPTTCFAHGRQIQCYDDKDGMTLRWETDVSQWGLNCRIRVGMGWLAGTYYTATGLTTTLPLVDNIWIQAPCGGIPINTGGRIIGTDFVAIDYHALGAELPPTTAVVCLEMIGGVIFHTQWLYVDSSVVSGPTTPPAGPLSVRTFPTGSYRYQVQGSQVRIKCGIDDVTLAPWALVYAPQYDILSGRLIELLFVIQTNGDGSSTPVITLWDTIGLDIPKGIDWDNFAIAGGRYYWVNSSDGWIHWA